MLKSNLTNNIAPSRINARGFTIVELLVVIVVIGILAAVTIVSYTGVTNRAKIAVIQSDLSNASKRLKVYQSTYSSYPTALNASYCPTAPAADATLCLNASGSNTFTYTSNGTTFNLIETNTNGMVYNVTESTAIAVYTDPWAENWYSGIAATALADKHIYKTDLGSTYSYKASNTAVASPQGATGLDPNYPSNMSLVSPQTNSSVDFSAYPAQNACKAIGGRLPNMQELLAIYAGRVTYGNNFYTPYYWSSTESMEYDSISNAYEVVFMTGGARETFKTDSVSVRCVAE